MTTVLLVGVGGFLGAIARYGVGKGLSQFSDAAHWIPYGTLAVNVIGCLVIGLVSGFLDQREGVSVALRAFIFVGILGGFTTFSAFGYETFTLVRSGELGAAASNIAIQVAAGLVAVWLGYRLANVG